MKFFMYDMVFGMRIILKEQGNSITGFLFRLMDLIFFMQNLYSKE